MRYIDYFLLKRKPHKWGLSRYVEPKAHLQYNFFNLFCQEAFYNYYYFAKIRYFFTILQKSFFYINVNGG